MSKVRQIAFSDTEASGTNRAIFYDGPSQLTGQPILGVVTGLAYASNNAKTGAMLQAWILLRDASPSAAIASGDDEAICGTCALRGPAGARGRRCYVTYWQTPTNIWTSLETAIRLEPSALAWQTRHQQMRLGAYGDPTAIPFAVWRELLTFSGGAIGYTQQWRDCDPAFRGILMASVLSPADQAEAAARGWRTYRVRTIGEAIGSGEVVCPASAETDHKLECAACMLCTGANSDRHANPVILAHGKPGNLKAFGMPMPGTIGRPRRRVIPLMVAPPPRVDPSSSLPVDIRETGPVPILEPSPKRRRARVVVCRPPNGDEHKAHYYGKGKHALDGRLRCLRCGRRSSADKNKRNAQWMRERRARYVAAGRCFQCGRSPLASVDLCARCAAARLERQREARQKDARAGRCYTCREPLDAGGSMCTTCREARRLKNAAIVADGGCIACHRSRDGVPGVRCAPCRDAFRDRQRASRGTKVYLTTPAARPSLTAAVADASRLRRSVYVPPPGTIASSFFGVIRK